MLKYQVKQYGLVLIKPKIQDSIAFHCVGHRYCVRLPQLADEVNVPFLLVSRIKNHLSNFELGFLNIFRAKTCCADCHSYCFCCSATSRFDFSQSENRKNNKKAFEGFSVEPTTLVSRLLLEGDFG